jgi:hypothetical protein
MVRTLLALVIFITQTSFGLNVMAATETTQSTQVVQQAGLELGATFEGRAVLGEPIFVLLSVRNVGEKPITLQNLTIEAMGLLSRVYNKSCNVSFSEQTIQPQKGINRTCSLSAARVPAEIFLYRQDRFRILASVKIASYQDPLPMALNLQLAMPEFSVVYGALVGTLLLVMFSTSFSYLQTFPRAPKDLSTLKSQAATYLARLPIRLLLSTAEMVLRAIQGGVVAIILIVLSRTTTEIGAPIAVRVDDFWGGLLVGIFSVPLASWLATKLAYEEREQPSSAGDSGNQESKTS